MRSPYYTVYTLVALLFSVLATTQSSGQDNLILNGNVDDGGGIQTLPAGWLPLVGTPDNCVCNDPKCVAASYTLKKTSPQGGAWIRFFNSTSHTERFGQMLERPMRTGCTYHLSFFCTYSALNSSSYPTAASIELGFSKGILGTKEKGVGEGHYYTVPMDGAEDWKYFEVTFVADDDYEFISFGKLEVDADNACYIDAVQLNEQCEISDNRDDRVIPDRNTSTLGSLMLKQSYPSAPQQPQPFARTLRATLSKRLDRSAFRYAKG